jgi:hypothetical protein
MLRRSTWDFGRTLTAFGSRFTLGAIVWGFAAIVACGTISTLAKACRAQDPEADAKPARRAKIGDLTARYRFIERYASGFAAEALVEDPTRRGDSALIRKYKVGIRRVSRWVDSTGKPSEFDEDKVVETIVFSEQPLEVNVSGRVMSVVRKYETYSKTATVKEEATDPKNPPLVGLTVYIKYRPGYPPELVSLTEKRNITQDEFNLIAEEIYIPSLIGLLPIRPVQIGESWPISPAAGMLLVGDSTDPEPDENQTTKTREPSTKAAESNARPADLAARPARADSKKGGDPARGNDPRKKGDAKSKPKSAGSAAKKSEKKSAANAAASPSRRAAPPPASTMFSGTLKEVNIDKGKPTALILIKGKIETESGERSDLAATLKFLFEIPDENAAPADRVGAALDTIELRGGIADIRMGEDVVETVFDVKDPPKGKIHWDLVVDRRINGAVDDLPALDAPPKPTYENSGIVVRDPKDRFRLTHPQTITFSGLNPENKSVFFLYTPTNRSFSAGAPQSVGMRLVVGSTPPEEIRDSWVRSWSQDLRWRVVPGKLAPLAAEDWPGRKAYHYEAFLEPDAKAMQPGSTRIHFDGYIVQFQTEATLVVEANTPGSPTSAFLDDLEATIKSFTLGSGWIREKAIDSDPPPRAPKPSPKTDANRAKSTSKKADAKPADRPPPR